jgi:hypothetical protein
MENVSLATPPFIPTSLTAIGGVGQIALKWNPSSDATSYNVSRSTTSGGAYTLVGNITSTNYIDSAVTNEITYYYVVSALNAGGQSANSAEASATPHAPLQLVVNFGPSGGQLTFSWPSWATGFALYSTTNLTPPTVWSPITNAIINQGLTLTVTLPVRSDNQFFRLFAQ